ncbi:C-type lectin domain family 4 member E-like [Biomphalaria glabrata]|uniref:C-type lectin domain family 4 member E-like n=1 Tax=Biomphalaria glabrata TaxID=6526 RepID=A0A9W2ZEP0_BIOGL|nr:C-type lectin domain family 4 member E-like [Biomphalaria glabrata]
MNREKEVYVACDLSDGFQLVTSGTTSACVWVSTNMTNYFFARNSCRGKSAYLYTVKTIGKLEILQKNYDSTSLWVGLNDIDVENVFRWEDDNTICDSTCRGQVFAQGEPNNEYDEEDCVHYYNSYRPSPFLNDKNCFTNLAYICEKPLFNMY